MAPECSRVTTCGGLEKIGELQLKTGSPLIGLAALGGLRRFPASGGTSAHAHAAAASAAASLAADGLATLVAQPAPPRQGANRDLRTPRGALDHGLNAAVVLGSGGAVASRCHTSAAHRTISTAQWPRHVQELAAADGARGLLPRGTFFECFVSDVEQPRRSGVYEFCVVGVDLTDPLAKTLSYHCWEPTGYFDRLFKADEIEQKIGLELFSRSVAHPRARRRHIESGADPTVLRWPPAFSTGSQAFGGFLPDLDERGRPVLPPGAKFPPRNSTDVLLPMLFRWKKDCLVPQMAWEGDRRRPFRILVLDGTGRFAARVLAELGPDRAEVVAAGTRRRAGHERRTLKTLRDCRHFSVDETALDADVPMLRFEDASFDAVIVPFLFHGVSRGSEQCFLRLLREAVRILRADGGQLVVAQELSPTEIEAEPDQATWERWRAWCLYELSAVTVLQGELAGSAVADSYLSAVGGCHCRRLYFVAERRVRGCRADACE
eukprot:TRINITY_DN24540_c0_g1_i1.p1 TRINITY_DN24540_c0_g1~~TRINITY_DN24540_c0_g1_i1.p1  ORF type:complete len:492 (-),score=79.17 TRINITY_DN24540_c0_g1_i1:56-1531(-)